MGIQNQCLLSFCTIFFDGYLIPRPWPLISVSRFLITYFLFPDISIVYNKGE